MKKYFLLLAILCGVAFGQLNFRQGAFWGDLSIASPSNYTLIGHLPANASITDIKLIESVHSTNTESTNSVQIGIVTRTNYFLSTTQCPMVIVPGIVRPTTACTNVGMVISSSKPTPIYGYITRVGAQVSAVGTLRVIVEYVQK